MSSEIDLSDVMQELPHATIFLQRPGVSARVKGVRRPSAPVTRTPFTANVQPTKARELRKIEGGETVESAISIWTTFELQTANDVKSHEADKVEFDGRLYKVIFAANWSGQGYRKFIAGEVVAK